MFSAQKASPRAKLLIARHGLKSASPMAADTIPATSERTRHLSLGRWTQVSSFMHREAHQRHRVFAYRCMDSIHRYLSWHNGSRPENSRAATRKSVAEWLQSNARPSKYTNADKIKSWSDDLSGVRPGRSIEDVEREAINHLFKAHVSWSSPLQAMRDHLHVGRAPRQVTAEEVLHATTGKDNLNYIDPITNKRVSRAEYGNYSKTTIDDPNAPRKLTPEEQSKKYEDLDSYKPTKWNEPDGLRKATPEEESKRYTDLNKYTPEIDDPTASRELTPEEQSKLYEDLDRYDKPVTWHEPDGLQTPTKEEDSKNYHDLDKYDGPVEWNEPDGLQPKTPEEKSKEYKDLKKYRAASWSKADGYRQLTPEEESKVYTDLDNYNTPFVAKESIIRAYGALLDDPTVKAPPLAKKVEVPDSPPHYEDLHKYGPVMWNEPDGLRLLTPEEKSKQYKDLDMYAQYDNAGGEITRVHPEEASKQYKDLSGYSAYGDSEILGEKIGAEEEAIKDKDLMGYSSYHNLTPEVERIHPEEASKHYEDLHAYPAAGYEEAVETQHMHPEEVSKKYDDLDKYQGVTFDSAERIVRTHPEEATKDYQDLDRYEKATPLVQEEYLEPMTADDIRQQVMQRAQAVRYEPAERDEEAGPDMSSMDESFPTEVFNAKDGVKSTEPIPNREMELQSTRSDEAAAAAAAAAASHKSSAAKTTTTTTTTAAEPCTYKILAYDPTTQCISVAETTCAQDDGSAPQGLGDVLLRLTHPSKFLPYFETAQAQGYDIVAGGGDVLVFRKARPASPGAEDFAPTVMQTKKKKRSLGRKVVMGTVWVGGVAYAAGLVAENLASGK